MFATTFQGGSSFEVLNTQGRDPLDGWKVSGRRSAVAKIFDKDVKGYVFKMDGGPSTKMQFPVDERKTPLSLFQPFFVLQGHVPLGSTLTIELVVADTDKNKRRMVFSTAVKEVAATPLHARIPLGFLRRNTWNNLVFDLADLVGNVFQGMVYRSLDAITITGSVLIRRIFTLKVCLMDTSNDADAMDLPTLRGPFDTLPRSLDFPAGVENVNQVVWSAKVRAVGGGGGGGGGGANGTASAAGTSSSGAVTHRSALEQHQLQQQQQQQVIAFGRRMTPPVKPTTSAGRRSTPQMLPDRGVKSAGRRVSVKRDAVRLNARSAGAPTFTGGVGGSSRYAADAAESPRLPAKPSHMMNLSDFNDSAFDGDSPSIDAGNTPRSNGIKTPRAAGKEPVAGRRRRSESFDDGESSLSVSASFATSVGVGPDGNDYLDDAEAISLTSSASAARVLRANSKSSTSPPSATTSPQAGRRSGKGRVMFADESPERDDEPHFGRRSSGGDSRRSSGGDSRHSSDDADGASATRSPSSRRGSASAGKAVVFADQVADGEAGALEQTLDDSVARLDRSGASHLSESLASLNEDEQMDMASSSVSHGDLYLSARRADSPTDAYDDEVVSDIESLRSSREDLHVHFDDPSDVPPAQTAQSASAAAAESPSLAGYNPVDDDEGSDGGAVLSPAAAPAASSPAAAPAAPAATTTPSASRSPRQQASPSADPSTSYAARFASPVPPTSRHPSAGHVSNIVTSGLTGSSTARNLQSPSVRPYTPPVLPAGRVQSGSRGEAERRRLVEEAQRVQEQQLQQYEQEQQRRQQEQEQRPQEAQPEGLFERRGQAASDATAADVDDADDEGDLELMYDPVLQCYYDPLTNKYYELATRAT